MRTVRSDWLRNLEYTISIYGTTVGSNNFGITIFYLWLQESGGENKPPSFYGSVAAGLPVSPGFDPRAFSLGELFSFTPCPLVILILVITIVITYIAIIYIPSRHSRYRILHPQFPSSARGSGQGTCIPILADPDPCRPQPL